MGSEPLLPPPGSMPPGTLPAGQAPPPGTLESGQGPFPQATPPPGTLPEGQTSSDPVQPAIFGDPQNPAALWDVLGQPPRQRSFEEEIDSILTDETFPRDLQLDMVAEAIYVHHMDGRREEWRPMIGALPEEASPEEMEANLRALTFLGFMYDWSPLDYQQLGPTLVAEIMAEQGIHTHTDLYNYVKEGVVAAYYAYRADKSAYRAFIAELAQDPRTADYWMADASRWEALMPPEDQTPRLAPRRLVRDAGSLLSGMGPSLTQGAITGGMTALGMMPVAGALAGSTPGIPDEAAVMALAFGSGFAAGSKVDFAQRHIGSLYRASLQHQVPFYINPTTGEEINAEVAVASGIQPAGMRPMPLALRSAATIAGGIGIAAFESLQVQRIIRGTPLERLFNGRMSNIIMSAANRQQGVSLTRSLPRQALAGLAGASGRVVGEATFEAGIEGLQALSEEAAVTIMRMASELITGEDFEDRDPLQIVEDLGRAFQQEFINSWTSFAAVGGAKVFGSVFYEMTPQMVEGYSLNNVFDFSGGGRMAIQMDDIVPTDPTGPAAVAAARTRITAARRGGAKLEPLQVRLGDDGRIHLVSDEESRGYPPPSAMLQAMREMRVRHVPVQLGSESVIDFVYGDRATNALNINRNAMNLNPSPEARARNLPGRRPLTSSQVRQGLEVSETLRSQVRENLPNISEQEVEASSLLLEIVAANRGQHIDEFLGQVFSPGVFAENQDLLQRSPGSRAAIQFVEDGRALITVSEDADFGSWVHEVGHLLRRWLPDDMAAQAAEWAGVEPGAVWTVEQEEAFTEAMTHYLRTGAVVDPQFQNVFKAVADWLRQLYEYITQHWQMDERITAVFEGLFATPGTPMNEARGGVIGDPLFQPGTPAFDQWFKEGAVIDDVGGPMPVYHASPRGGFTQFDRSGDLGFHFGSRGQAETRLLSVTRRYREEEVDPGVMGVWDEVEQRFLTNAEIEDMRGQSKLFGLTTSGQEVQGAIGVMAETFKVPGVGVARSAANELERARRESPRTEDFFEGSVYEVYLNIQNPFRMPDMFPGPVIVDDLRDVGERLGAPQGMVDRWVQLRQSWWNNRIIDQEVADRDLHEMWMSVRGMIEQAGYDGVVYDNIVEGTGDSWVALYANQIKSVYNPGPTESADILNQPAIPDAANRLAQIYPVKAPDDFQYGFVMPDGRAIDIGNDLHAGAAMQIIEQMEEEGQTFSEWWMSHTGDHTEWLLAHTDAIRVTYAAYGGQTAHMNVGSRPTDGQLAALEAMDIRTIILSNDDGDRLFQVNITDAAEIEEILKRTAWMFQPAIPNTPEVRRFLGESRARDTDDQPLRLFHGSTYAFDQFDLNRVRGGNLGEGIYLSTSPRDVGANYANEGGPDLADHIEMAYDNLLQFADDDTEGFISQFEDRLSEQEIADLEEGKGPEGLDIVKRLAVEVTSGGAPNMIPAVVNITNPVIIGDQPLTAGEETVFTLNEDGKGTLVDLGNLLVSYSQLYAGPLANMYTEAMDNGGTLTVRDVYGWVDDEEVLRQAFEEMGFDGIIDRTVYQKFGLGGRPQSSAMEGVEEDTVHVLAFNPNQVKSVFNLAPTDDPRLMFQPPEYSQRDTTWILDADDAIEFAPDSRRAIDHLVALQDRLYGDAPPSMEESLDIAQAEIEYMLAREHEGEDIGRNWYTESIARTRAGLSAHFPTLANDEDWHLFLMITALTSNNTVAQNLRIAVDVYGRYLEDGVIYDKRADGRAYSPSAGVQLRKIQRMIDTFGSFETAMEWFLQPGTVGEGREWGTTLRGKRDDVLDRRILALGPKVSEFILSMMGYPDAFTIDRWAYRTWARWRSEIEPDTTGKGIVLHESSSASSNPQGREDFINLARQLSTQFDMTMPEVQAVLWYYEKRLWRSMGIELQREDDYALVAERAAAEYFDQRGQAPVTPGGGGNPSQVTPGRADANFQPPSHSARFAVPPDGEPRRTGTFRSGRSDIVLDLAPAAEGKGYDLVARDDSGVIATERYASLDAAVASASGQWTDAGAPLGDPDYRFDPDTATDPDAVARQVDSFNRARGIQPEARHPGTYGQLPRVGDVRAGTETVEFGGWAVSDNGEISQLRLISRDELLPVEGEEREDGTAPIWIEELADGTYEVVEGGGRLGNFEGDIEAFVLDRYDSTEVDEHGDPIRLPMTIDEARRQLRYGKENEPVGDRVNVGEFDRSEITREQLEDYMVAMMAESRFHGAGMQPDFWRIAAGVVRDGEMSQEMFDSAFALMNQNPDLYREVFDQLDMGELSNATRALLGMDLREGNVSRLLDMAREHTLRDEIAIESHRKWDEIAATATGTLADRISTEVPIRDFIRRGGPVNTETRQQARRFLNRLARDVLRPVSNSTDYWYRASIEFLQAGLDPKFRSTMTEADRIEMQAFLGAAEFQPDVPKRLLTRMARKPINEWTVDEIFELHARVQELRLLGRLKAREEQAARRRAFEQTMSEIAQNIATPQGPRPAQGTPSATELQEPDRVRDRANNLRPQRMFDLADGGSAEFDPNGPVFRTFHTDPANAYDQVLRREDARFAPIEELVRAATPGALSPGLYFAQNIGKKVTDPRSGEKFSNLSRDSIMSIYMLMQAPTGEFAVNQGMGIDNVTAKKLIALLRPQDIEIAEALLADYEANFVRLRQATIHNLNRDLGRIKGRYSPLRWITDATGIQDFMEAELNATGWARAGINRGFTEQRADLKTAPGEVQLGALAMWTASVRNQEYFIGMFDAHRAAARIAFDPQFQRMVSEQFGPSHALFYKNYANRLADPYYKRAEPGGPLSELSARIRRNMAPTFLGFNALTSFKQVPSVFLYVPEAGMGYLTRQMMRATTDFGTMRELAFAKDARMAHRNIDRTIDELRTTSPSLYREMLRKYGEVGMWAIYKMDEVATVIGWNAVYQRGIDSGLSESEAAARARDATLRTQPASHVFDVAEMYMTNKEHERWALQFTNQLSQLWNIATYDAPRRTFKGERSIPKRVRNAGAAALALGINQMAMWVLSNRRLPEDEEDIVEMLLEMPAAYIPYWGRPLQSFIGGYDPFDAPLDILPEAFRALQGQPFAPNTRRTILEATGLLTGLVPATLIERGAQFFETRQPVELLGGRRE